MNPITPAEAAIRERIAREGRVTFRDFMEMALYTAPGSYYGSSLETIGVRGDYFTSPEVHPSFGALVARQVEQVWVAMGRPDRFTLIEMGAGTGSLARDLLAYAARWSPPFHRAIHYAIVERGPALVDLQARALAGHAPSAGKVTWYPSLDAVAEPRSVEGCFLSNELLDSFPVHRVVVEGGGPREVYLEVRQGRFVEVLGEPSRPDLDLYFRRLGLLPPEGCRAEVNLDALGWMEQVAALLRRGIVLTVDYGYEAEELYSPRHRDGTLLCFYRHTLNSDPYVRVGLQDMTTHVDFTSLVREGEEHGLQALGLTTQRSFLAALGMNGYLEMLPGLGLRAADYEANRLAMRELARADGLGRVKVLMQHRGLEGFEPAGFRPEGLRSEDLQRDWAAEPPPLLTRSHMRLTAAPETDLPFDAEGMWHELFGEPGE